MANGQDVAFTRYVAIGDSQTEGLWDGDDSGGIVGFADRLAAMLDSHHPGLQYANLAIRGRRIRDVLDDQLPRALAMRPDLITVCVGMNDITRPGLLFDRALADLDLLHERLAGSGATVVTTTFPDIARIVPVGRILTSRMLRMNGAITAAAEHYGFKLVDLYSAPSMTQPDVWSDDRVHRVNQGSHPVRRRGRRSPRSARRATMIGRRPGQQPRSRHCVRAPVRNCCGRRTCSPRGCGTTPAAFPAGTAASRSARGRTVWSARSRAVRERDRRLAPADQFHHPRAEKRDRKPGEHIRSSERHACRVRDLRRDVRGILSRVGQHRADGLAHRDQIGRIGCAPETRVGHRVQKRIRCVGSAWAGAASSEAVAATPANTAIMRNGPG